MIRRLDFNPFAAGTVIDDEYEATDGVTVSAEGGSGQAMAFDTNNPTGDDADLASDTLDGVLIISKDGDSDEPDDTDTGGSIFFDFDTPSLIKSLTFKDIEETGGDGTRMFFYRADGTIIDEHFVQPTADGGERVIGLSVDDVSRMEIRFQGAGAVDNLVFDDKQPLDEGPMAIDDNDETDEDTAVIIDLRGNDTDPDNLREELVIGDFVSTDGTVTDLGDGTVSFLPNPDFHGETSFTYTLTDPDGNFDTGEAAVFVNPVNDTPEALDDADITDFGTPVTIDLLANDYDVDSETLTVTEATVLAVQGSLVDNGDGTVEFTPAAGFTGDATINYNIADNDGGEASALHKVTVNPAELVPTANPDSAETPEDTAVTINVLENDIDPQGDPLIITGASVPVDQGIVEIVENEILFTPAADFNGPGTIAYVVEDPEGNSAEGSVAVEVTPVNDDPSAADGADTTPQDTPIIVDLLENDSDIEGDTLFVTQATIPVGQGTLQNNGDGTVTFSPAETFTGPATISYAISDGNGGVANAAHVVEVTPVIAAPPVANDDTGTTVEDTSVIVDLRGNDTDPDNTRDELILSDLLVDPTEGAVADNGDGTVTFTPAAEFHGDATITYTLTDPDGASDDAQAFVTVTPVNDAPDAEDDVMGTAYNTAIEDIAVLANDTDVDGNPLRVVTAISADGRIEINPDSTLTFIPVDGFIGPAEINYTISDRPEDDPDALFDRGTVIVNVAEPGERDGIVEGTDEGDLIDTEYRGDPDGDLVDNEDAIIPGQEPNDDILRAGAGDDTVLAGAGNDNIDGGDGDDNILGAEGRDTVDGGAGADVINTSGSDLAPDQGYPDATTDDLGFVGDDDPENDRDFVDGGAGNDRITTGDDRDTIIGGTGEDIIDAGIDDDIVDGDDDDDRIVGGEGSDTIFGGAGNDTIYAGNDPDGIGDLLDTPDEAIPDVPFSPDRNPDNGRDVVQGGAGADLIFGGDDDDSLVGGSGEDTINGQFDDDTISGGSGSDLLLGGQGNDTIDGGTGEDTLEGGIGEDTLRGNRNSDILFGGDGDDVLDGGGDDDLLDGGDGADNLQGGQGDDTLRGGAGEDTMTGGAGQDVFTAVGAGDDIDGGSGPVDNDTLDLRGSAPEGGHLEVVYASDDRESGVVNYFDVEGADAGQLVFEEIENVIPCFTPGTKIATPRGERLIETLRVGDRIITRDNGIQNIRWVGAREMTGVEFDKAAHLKPVLIRQGALGNDLPERDMMVSPNHRVLVANDKTALYFEDREVLVAAKHLTGLEGVGIADVPNTTYIHIMFDQHEVILSDGAWTESFQPGDMSLAGIGRAQRQEILEIFPELATKVGVDGYVSARRSLKKHEAMLIAD